MDVLLNDGDSLLVENPSYPGTLAALKAMDIRLFGTDIDEHGLVVDNLKQMLDRWNENSETKAFAKPKVIYSIPTGTRFDFASVSSIPVHD